VDFDDILLAGPPFSMQGACCLSDGSCQDGVLEAECAGSFRGQNTTCGTDGATCNGACCNQEIECRDTKITECGSDWQGYGTRCATTSCPCHATPADADGDNDVDQLDFAAFQRCVSPDVPVLGGTCKCFDVANAVGDPVPDSYVDAQDFAKFEQCASGPGIPLNPNCDQ
jgi:hypothetical protein